MRLSSVAKDGTCTLLSTSKRETCSFLRLAASLSWVTYDPRDQGRARELGRNGQDENFSMGVSDPLPQGWWQVIKHLWQDTNGVIHACEKTEVSALRDSPTLVWTKCDIDVPANTSFESGETVTCPKCEESE